VSPSLDDLARGLARAIDDRRAEQPFLIELAGTPRAGKTTLLTRLSGMLTDHGVRVSSVHESAARCPIPDKRLPKFNVWTFCDTIGRLGRLLGTQHLDTDIVLIDRGVVDAAFWMEWYRATGLLSAEHHVVIEAFVLLPLWTDLMDLVLVMTASPDVALQRDGVRDGRRERGQIVNEVTISEFNASVARLRERYGAHDPIVHLDTTHLHPDEVLRHLIDAALTRL
jgi:hypothetical protein